MALKFRVEYQLPDDSPEEQLRQAPNDPVVKIIQRMENPNSFNLKLLRNRLNVTKQDLGHIYLECFYRHGLIDISESHRAIYGEEGPLPEWYLNTHRKNPNQPTSSAVLFHPRKNNSNNSNNSNNNKKRGTLFKVEFSSNHIKVFKKIIVRNRLANGLPVFDSHASQITVASLMRKLRAHARVLEQYMDVVMGRLDRKHTRSTPPELTFTHVPVFQSTFARGVSALTKGLFGSSKYRAQTENLHGSTTLGTVLSNSAGSNERAFVLSFDKEYEKTGRANARRKATSRTVARRPATRFFSGRSLRSKGNSGRSLRNGGVSAAIAKRPPRGSATTRSVSRPKGPVPSRRVRTVSVGRATPKSQRSATTTRSRRAD